MANNETPMSVQAMKAQSFDKVYDAIRDAHVEFDRFVLDFLSFAPESEETKQVNEIRLAMQNLRDKAKEYNDHLAWD